MMYRVNEGDKNFRVWFSTHEFEREHNKAPRGYGFWGFRFEGHEFWAKGTYTEAKMACIREVSRLAPAGYSNAVSVEVLA